MYYKEKIEKIFQDIIIDYEEEILLEKPKQKDHGDLSTNIAMKLAKKLKKSPSEIANDIKNKISTDLISKVEIANPGFINLVISNGALIDSISQVCQELGNYGRAKRNKGKVLVEFVSANPTGDLHIGHGRQAAIGDTLARLLDAAGYEVSKEFYINDYGEQIKKLSESSIACLKKINGEHVEWSEDFYPEEMLKDYVLQLKNTNEENIGKEIKNLILEAQRKLLESINVTFDKWYSEADLHTSGKVDEIISLLLTSNKAYESEGAIWFKAKDAGDVRDRVLKRSDGRPTYITADIAYHLDKLNRGYDKLINVWGADHHGQEVGLKAAIDAAGGCGNKLEVVFVQLVSLKQSGAEVKMSKRAGTVVTVQDLFNEVGVDAFRYFLIESSPNNRMVFDIDLAKKQDKDNPVFYIQYAHARCCSIFRQINQSGLKASFNFKRTKSFEKLFSVPDKEYEVTKDLVLKILDFPQEVQIAAQNRSGSRIAAYLKDLAAVFHQFYTVCRVITDDGDITLARLGLVEATKITLANGLNLLGISAPDKM